MAADKRTGYFRARRVTATTTIEERSSDDDVDDSQAELLAPQRVERVGFDRRGADVAHRNHVTCRLVVFALAQTVREALERAAGAVSARLATCRCKSRQVTSHDVIQQSSSVHMFVLSKTL